MKKLKIKLFEIYAIQCLHSQEILSTFISNL